MQHIRKMKWYQFIVLTLMAMYSVSTDCPNQCTCSDTELVCNKSLPSFVPETVTQVTVYAIPAGDVLNFSNSGWMNVTHLSLNLENADNQTKRYIFRTLHAYEFTGLMNLEYLQIKCTGRCYLWTENNTFYGLNNVKVLNLSNNAIISTYFLMIGLTGKDILPHLSELYLSNINRSDNETLYFDLGYLHNAMKDKPLKVLDMSGNTNLELYNYDNLPLLPQLVKLNISNTGQALFTFLRLNDRQSPSRVFQNLQVLDASYPYFPSSLSECELTPVYWPFCDNNDIFHSFLPHRLTELFVKNIFKSPTQLRGTSNTTHLCIMNNFFEQNTTLCVTGNFSLLQKIVMSENSITYIQPDLIYPFERLKYLDIGSNNLGEAIADQNYANSFFNALKHTEVLILSNNNITVIPKDVFNNNINLRSLGLSHNKLNNVDFGLQYLVVLEYLDLSFNSITVIPKDVFNNNINLRSLDLSHNKLNNVDFGLQYLVVLEYLDLSFNNIIHMDADSCSILKNLNFRQNISNSSLIQQAAQTEIKFEGNPPFLCSCDNVCFLKFIVELNETHTCLLDDKTVIINDLNVRKAEYMCYETIVIAVFSTLAVIIAMLIAITTYFVIQEWRKVQLEKLERMRERLIQNGREVIKNEPVVFLSYSSDDAVFVGNNVYPNLNSGLKDVLRVESRCVATGDLDMCPGQPIAEEIIRCLESSSLVIFFVSDSFCKNPWCRFEVVTAASCNIPTVLMMYDKVDKKLMPPILRSHYDTYTRAHWSMEEVEPVMTPSWDHLCENIVRLIGTNQIP